jgi:signal transduction histidine kinase
MGYADLMVDTASEGKTLSVAELSEYGRMLQVSGARLFRIVENLLFWARLEAPKEASGRRRHSVEDVTPSDLIQLAESVGRQFGRPFDAAVDCTEGARVQAATTGLAFVLRHLVENAFKFSLPGSQVSVAAHPEPREFVVSVRDAGRGMTADQVARVMALRPFDREGTGEQGGTGMGLMLATTFARASGGHLKLGPGPGEKGLVVELRIPIAADISRA